MFTKKIIAFDIGKTKILAAVLKMERDNYEFFDLVESKNPRNSKKIEKIILDYAHAAQKKYKTKKVAISAAHLVNNEKKIVSQGKVCYGADTFSFSFLEQAGFSVKIENDGRCFALGEYHFGKGRNADSLLALNLGTEIGGGFVIDGKNWRGAHNSALEVSNMGANYSGKWKGWGGICAGKGIENIYRQKNGKKISTKEVFLEAGRGDKIAKEAISEAVHNLGMGVASLINILDPERIVFGGSLAKQRKYIDEAVKIAKKNVFNRKANYKFSISTLGNKANLLGAARYYFEK
ncbi:MAG: ROK family protein [Candidatus Moranbacteria bacterium]|nr:ROK family protein [Candidatus Moranbacteria bacterium]